MKRLFLALLVLLAAPAITLQAEVVQRPATPDDLAAIKAPAQLPPWAAKVDYADSILLLPFFEVDKNTPGGEVTLYTVRNVQDVAIDLTIDYLSTGGVQLIPTTEVELGAKETLAVNINDVPGLPADPDGFARGWALIVGQPGLIFSGDDLPGNKGLLPSGSFIVGDFFQAIPNQDFATGDRLLTAGLNNNPYSDLCQSAEVRFLNGGAFSGGTKLKVYVGSPNGSDPDSDPASFVLTFYDEMGNSFEPVAVFADQNVLELDAGDFAGGLAAGTMEVEFNEFGGAIFASFSAENRFSVGLRAACKPSSIIVSP